METGEVRRGQVAAQLAPVIITTKESNMYLPSLFTSFRFDSLHFILFYLFLKGSTTEEKFFLTRNNGRDILHFISLNKISFT